MTVIIGIKLPDKILNAVEFQRILTEFNCAIKLRIGINSNSLFCSKSGLILLQIDNKEDAEKIEKALLDISEIELQRMYF